MQNLDWIAGQEYLGRGMLVGRTEAGVDFATYAITARSPSSRARKLVNEWNKDRVRTECTDQEQLAKGTPALLIYNAIRRVGDVFIVSNGAQTDVIAEGLEAFGLEGTPKEILAESLLKPRWVQEIKDGEFTGKYIDLTSFEPDGPTYTPRISGILTRDGAALSIARRVEGTEFCEKQDFGFPLVAGRAKFIATYTGTNVPKDQPIPGWNSVPLDIDLLDLDPSRINARVWRYLGPKEAGSGIISPEEDFRIGVSTVGIHRTPRPSIETYLSSMGEPKVA